jgi:trehalose synthase-fused probable maltokinase
MDERASGRTLPTLTVEGAWSWPGATRDAGKQDLAVAMTGAIASRRWFGSKTRAIESLQIVDAIGVSETVWLLLAKIHFKQGPAEVYQVPLGYAEGESAARLLAEGTAAWIRVVSAGGRIGVLYDALGDADFCRQLLELFESPRALRGIDGELIVEPTASFDRVRGNPAEKLTTRLVQAEQSNTSVIYGDRLILKLFRRVEMGLNPDFEISEQLTRQRFANTPGLAGTMEYRPEHDEPWALAMLQAFVPNQGDAWKFTLDWLATSLRAPDTGGAVPATCDERLCRAAERPIPDAVREFYGEFLSSVELLGRRTAEMHLALAADSVDPAFAPEPFAETGRRDYFGRCADEARATFQLLAGHAPRLSGRTAEQARRVARLEPLALDRYAGLVDKPIDVYTIRCHGDYHLGQVLWTGDDFMIIDFEGEPVRSIDERRRKQLAMRDVAGMIRSLHYASCTAASEAQKESKRDDGRIEDWTRAWYAWSSVAFLAAYRQTVAESVFMPAPIDAFERLLDGCLLEKALYELRYELNNRPDWVYLPLEALVELLGGDTRDP